MDESNRDRSERRSFLLKGENLRKTLIRAILPQWAAEQNQNIKRVLEGEYNEDEIFNLNSKYYNIYFLPNHPQTYNPNATVDGSNIDTFNYIFVDMDLKEKAYADSEEFTKVLYESELKPSKIVLSGNGVHAYWKVSELDAMTFLKLQRRLCRAFNTDVAVCKIYQLMRLPGTINTKDPKNLKLCETIEENESVYSCEQLDTFLPILTHEDEDYCTTHFNKTYEIKDDSVSIDDKLPVKFGALLKSSQEVKDIWAGNTDDRSKSDYRMGHIMFASGFTKKEALSVLVNSSKAMQRAPKHRVNYASNIVDKIWTYEIQGSLKKLSNSVKDILARGESTVSGTRFPCHKLLDDTVTGFRLGHVIGLVAGSGVGKTSMAINMFKWFTELNPDFDHFFVSLEQTDNEIAARWRTICQGDDRLHEKVHVLSNYDEAGVFRNLSLDDIKDYILQFQKQTGKKIGTCVIDHIGALKKQNKNGENEGIMEICHKMKSFAIETNTLVVMQSQAPREKAGSGDLELNKDCAYGSVFFESYVDWLLAIWQPLKRAHADGAPTVMAFKYCKIRHKKQGKDNIQEDVCYRLFFDPQTETLRELTQDEEKSFSFFQNQVINIRKRDRKTDVVPYQSRNVDGLDANAKERH